MITLRGILDFSPIVSNAYMVVIGSGVSLIALTMIEKKGFPISPFVVKMLFGGGVFLGYVYFFTRNPLL